MVFLYQYNEPPIGGVERYWIALMCSITFFVIVFMTSDLCDPPVYWCIFPFIGFGTGMLWIYIEANEILNILTSLGEIRPYKCSKAFTFDVRNVLERQQCCNGINIPWLGK